MVNALGFALPHLSFPVFLGLPGLVAPVAPSVCMMHHAQKLAALTEMRRTGSYCSIFFIRSTPSVPTD